MVDISRNRCSTVCNMQLSDILHVLCKHGGKDFDMVGMLDAMVTLNLIQRETRQKLQRKYSYNRVAKSSDTFPEFMLELCLVVTSFDVLYFAFEMCGYETIAKDLRRRRYQTLLKPVPRGEILHSTETQTFYKQIKSCIDNNCFKHRKATLENFIHINRKKTMNENLRESQRQIAMEKTVAATVVLLTLHKDYNKRKQILESAIRMETNGVDDTSLRIVYHSKMAVTEAEAGHMTSAEEHITETKLLCSSYSPCFAVTSALHDIEYTSQTFFFMNPTEQSLKRVLKDGDIAFQSVEDNEESVKHLWQRILLLLMALPLLFITPVFERIDKKVQKKNKIIARQIILAVLARCDGIEHRRKMIVSLCQAALFEDTDLDLAISYAQEAVKGAEAGGCFSKTEEKNVVTYSENILWLKKRRLIIRLCLCLLVLVMSILLFML